jgi:hypothetical protein
MGNSSLVMSRKAVRVRSSALFFTCKSLKNEESPIWGWGLCQLALAEGCYLDKYSGLRKFNV